MRHTGSKRCYEQHTSYLLFAIYILCLAVGFVPLRATAQSPPVLFEDVSDRIPFLHHSVDAGGDGLAGAAWFDFDIDGDLDLFLPNGKNSTNALFRNNADGTFSNIAKDAGVENGLGNSAAVAADFDNDGWPDLFLTGEGGSLQGTAQAPLHLFRNTRDGKFEDVTPGSGLQAPPTHLAASAADIDNDGLVDIFISAPGSLALKVNHQNRMYRNLGNFRFEDVSAQSGLNTQLGACATMFADYDNDGWQDLFVATCNDKLIRNTPLELFRNNGDGTFTERAQQAGLARGGLWMGLCGSDYDRDGDFDIFVTNTGPASGGGQAHALWRNNGNGTFTDVALFAGVADLRFGWGCTFSDFDNDGLDDLFFTGSLVSVCPPQAPAIQGSACLALNLIGPGLGNRGSLLFNDGKGRFVNHSGSLPVNMERMYSSGVAAGDFDNDGATDLVIAVEGVPAIGNVAATPAQPVLLRNEGSGNNWLDVKLLGRGLNRSAIGARVTLSSGDETQIKEIRAGSGHLSQHSQVLHFGLGANGVADTLNIRWPDGTEEVLSEVDVNRTLNVEQGRGERVVDWAQTGAYFDVSRDGEGIFLEVLDGGLVVLAMFTFSPDGKDSAWLLGVGRIEHQRIIVDELQMTAGGKFGAAFDADAIERISVGSLTIDFPVCLTATVPGRFNYQGNGTGGFENLEVALTRLTLPFDCDDRSPPDGATTLSGSYFDPDRSGEGIFVEILPDSSVVLIWYTYDGAGNQFWTFGTGTLENGRVEIDALYPAQKAAFGSGFDPGDVSLESWGTLVVEFHDCNNLKLSYDAIAPFGTGELEYTRLTRISGTNCFDPVGAQ